MPKRKRSGSPPAGGKRKRLTGGKGVATAAPSPHLSSMPQKVWEKVFNQHEAFCWTVRGMVQQREWKRLRGYLADWWRTVYGPTASLPRGGVHAIDVYIVIQYEVLAKGYEVNGVELPKKVQTNLTAARILLEDRPRAIQMFTPVSSSLFQYEESSEFGQLIINFTNEEAVMAAKKRAKEEATEKKTAKKTVAKKAAKTTTKKSNLEEAAEELGTKKAGKAKAKAKAPKQKEEKPEKEKKLTATQFCIDLLLKEEFTDKEIAEKMAEQFNKTVEHYARWAASYRRQLAAGTIARYGVVELSQIVEEEEDEE